MRVNIHVKIVVNKAKEYSGMRGAWFRLLSQCDGKDIDVFFAKPKPSSESSRGWLKFFLRDGALQLK